MKHSRPNIVFCISDDQSYPHASAYGCKWVNTPGFDRVARDGILFANAFTPNAKCAPSRASVLTGRYSWQLEEACNHICYFPAKFRVFTEILQEAGYFVGYTGKGWAPGNPGYYPDGSVRQLTGREYSRRKLKPPTRCISNKDYAGNFYDFLNDKPDDRPFCFWCGGHEPHRAYEFRSGIEVGGKRIEDIDAVPRYWPDCADVRADMLDYAFEVEWFDTHLARMIEILRQRGELDNTLIVVTSDNGAPFPRIKGQQYEYAYHEPLAMMWPAEISPGRRVDDLVNFVDFAPTFLDIAGLPVHSQMTGRSLANILYSDESGVLEPDREVIYGGKELHDVGRPNNVGYPIRTLRDARYLYLRNYEPDRWPAGDPEVYYRNIDDSPTKTIVVEEMERGNDAYWKLCMGKRPEEELYDIHGDPHCVDNLAHKPEFADVRKQMRERLEADLKAHEDPRFTGHPDIFDTYQYVNTREIAMVYQMWEKVRQSGGKYRFKKRSAPELVEE